MPGFQDVIVEDIITEAEDVLTFRLKLKSGEPLSFKPGQFGNFFITLPDGKILGKPFSYASSPLEKRFFDYTIKIEHGGRFTPHLLNVKKGDTLRVTGPFGIFFFDENKAPKEGVAFLAGGVGITPLMCMIRYCTDKGIALPLTLLFSSKKSTDIIYFKDLEALQKRNPHLKVVHCITREAPEDWPGEKSRINSDIVKKHVPNWQNAEYFMCGPEQMIEDSVKFLTEMGIPKERVHKESW